MIITTDDGTEVDRFEMPASEQPFGDRLELFVKVLVKAISEAQQIERYGRVLY